MIFKIRTKKRVYSTNSKISGLEYLGFYFEENKGSGLLHIKGDPTISISSIDELSDFSDKFGNISILKNNEDKNGYSTILILNGF